MERRNIVINSDGLIVDRDSGEVIRPVIIGFDIPLPAPATPKRRP